MFTTAVERSWSSYYHGVLYFSQNCNLWQNQTGSVQLKCLFAVFICLQPVVYPFIHQYGKQLYINFQEAMRRTEAAYDWSSLSSSSIKSGSSSSSLPGMSAYLGRTIRNLFFLIDFFSHADSLCTTTLKLTVPVNVV